MGKTSDVLLKPSLTWLNNRFYVYTIFSLKDKKFYTGYTLDLRKRISEHTKGLSRATKFRRPFLLIHYEYLINELDAKARERFLKSGFGRKQLKAELKRTLEKLNYDSF